MPDEERAKILAESEVVQKAAARNFRLEELRGEAIGLPQNEVARPHPDALEWHRSNVWLK